MPDSVGPVRNDRHTQETDMARLLEAMRERMVGAYARDTRADKRHAWRVKAVVETQEHGRDGRPLRRAEAPTLDISEHGVAYHSARPIASGTTIFVTLPLPGKPRIEGIVRHCTHVRGSTHHVGVEFVNTPAS